MLAPGAAMERRHEAMRRIERDFIQAFPFIAALVRAEAALDGDGQQRALHRIAFHRPFPLLLAELGIVAENAAAEDVRGRAGRRWIILTFGLERRSEEHTSELQSLMRISYAVFCLKKQNT